MAVHGYKVVLTVIADGRTVTRWRGTGVSSRQTIRAWMARSVGGGLEGLINPHQFWHHRRRDDASFSATGNTKALGSPAVLVITEMTIPSFGRTARTDE